MFIINYWQVLSHHDRQLTDCLTIITKYQNTTKKIVKSYKITKNTSNALFCVSKQYSHLKMSRHSSRERSVTIADGDGLAVIREEQASAFVSKDDVSFKNDSIYSQKPGSISAKYGEADVETLLAKREAQLRAEFDDELKTQLGMLRERFDFVLQHEQVRSCYMLREAHRERKEKVQALQTQLECKNLTGLMYVMCSERRKAKLEKMRIISEYTNYIHTLQDILTEGQRLILHLSRGYKTAARVDNEWRQKMRSIIREFQEYVYHFAGGTPESNQYVFDVPVLLKTETSIFDDPNEDPCTCEEEEKTVVDEDGVIEDKTWWELLDSPCKPFVMFGDMAEFQPPQRRQVLASAKEALKTAPPKWKDYVFNEMFLKSDCPRADVIKDEYPKHLPVDKWECHVHADNDSSDSSRLGSRRMTTNSNEMRNMGSILKIITSSGLLPPKTNLLAARDSMEIASSTKIRGKKNGNNDAKNVSICIARTRSSSLHNLPKEFMPGKPDATNESDPPVSEQQRLSADTNDEAEVTGNTKNGLESIQDSLLVIPAHKADTDHKINYEKICPIDKCQRMQVDSFMRSLPAYMHASPYMLFEQTFAEYETCSPEQLEILQQRLEQKQKRQMPEEDTASVQDFEQAVDGVGVQTSDELLTGLPPCTCKDPSPSLASSTTRIFRVEDLIPMKEALDEITKECFYSQNIVFDRFKVVGQESRNSYNNERKDKEEFKKLRVQEIKNILRKHPSMLDLFQPNPQC
ncbi:uncharacterized protein LOC133529706 [Cydia pomonella]|uniref:uncharacterized protein LOC133529706 n=1 Tax=Cydia pomonella TaxID=82600 RepID=UPI002ADDD288|nr:uncharacterized protein LOC133529706 [Cydia pomonella]